MSNFFETIIMVAFTGNDIKKPFWWKFVLYPLAIFIIYCLMACQEIGSYFEKIFKSSKS